ncbi:hypothetical protein TUZN_1548 [Thermoproteus uzoniensis 768-20]|uniref:Uncharacterized protein n=1 Tax=Thermoproteus uzoniensis (strain 768-20) TaxID=999630 RepID=F2L289_THEU7|nr:hypothetical protein TUZN_1548 [Thermoproteus uzoniensis 768-20]
MEGGLTGGKAGGALCIDATWTKYSTINAVVTIIIIVSSLCIVSGSNGFLNIKIISNNINNIYYIKDF